MVYTGDNDIGDKHKVANIYANFRKILLMAPMRYSESRGKLIYEEEKPEIENIESGSL